MKKKELCSLCESPIRVPICKSCFLRLWGKWILQASNDAKEIIKLTRQIKNNLTGVSSNHLSCLVCNSPALSICSRCYFEQDNLIKVYNKLAYRQSSE